MKALKKSIKYVLTFCLLLAISLSCVSGSFAKDKADKVYKIKVKGYAKLEGYDYSKAAPALSKPPADSYFNDAVIFGNSRAKDLVVYSDIGKTKAKPYCDIGLNIANIYKKRFVPYDGVKIEALTAFKKDKKAKKVFIIFGINELGFISSDAFVKSYKDFVDNIRKINKNVIIYAHSILPVSHKKDITDNTFLNVRIKKYNKCLMDICKEKHLIYIDAYSQFCNSEWCLPENVSADGIHFGPSFSKKWYEFIKNHTVKTK